MADKELCYLPATELLRRYREGEFSPVEYIRNALDRIDEVNPALNCFCFTYPDESAAQARGNWNRSCGLCKVCAV